MVAHVEQQKYQFSWDGVGEHVMPPKEEISDILYMGRGLSVNLEYGSEEMLKSFAKSFFAGGHHMNLAWKAHEFAKNTYKEIGAIRDTGETYLTHALRLMNRFFGFYSTFQMYCDETNRGFNIWDDYSATKMLSASTVVGYLHDLPEDINKFQYKYSTYLDKEEGVRKIRVNQQTLYGSSPMMQLIGYGLEALKKPEGYKDFDPITVAQYQVAQILDLPKKLRLVQDELGLTEEQIEFFSFLIATLKLCDRLDNEMTLFRGDPETVVYTPMSDKTVANVIDTTLGAFYPLEEAVTHYIFGDRSDQQAVKDIKGESILSDYQSLFRAWQPTEVASRYKINHINKASPIRDSELGYRRAWKNVHIFPHKERFWCHLYVPNVLDENASQKLTDYFEFYRITDSRYWRMSKYAGKPRVVGNFN